MIGAALALLAALAPAPARVDREHGVRFDLEGTVLTVSLTRPDAGEELWGKRITAACSPVFSSRPSRRAVHTTQLWPDGATELSYTFARDISIQGADVADFTPGHTVYGRDDVKLRKCRARKR